MAPPAEHANQTVEFTFDGVQYTLPLDGNTGKIRGHMQPWMDAEPAAEADA